MHGWIHKRGLWAYVPKLLGTTDPCSMCGRLVLLPLCCKTAALLLGCCIPLKVLAILQGSRTMVPETIWDVRQEVPCSTGGQVKLVWCNLFSRHCHVARETEHVLPLNSGLRPDKPWNGAECSPELTEAVRLLNRLSYC